MKTYKLIKDLPTWKAGDTFILKENWNLFWNENGTEVMVYFSATIEKFDILNNEEWFEEIPQKPKSIWDLKEWDDFWFISISNIYKHTIDTYESFEMSYLEPWNVFFTQEEAEQELNKRKAIQRVRKYCYENNTELFSDEELKEILKNNADDNYLKITHFYNIYYHELDKQFYSSISNSKKYIDYFYFKEIEDVEQVIKNCESDLKIIFNV